MKYTFLNQQPFRIISGRLYEQSNAIFFKQIDPVKYTIIIHTVTYYVKVPT